MMGVDLRAAQFYLRSCFGISFDKVRGLGKNHASRARLLNEVQLIFDAKSPSFSVDIYLQMCAQTERKGALSGQDLEKLKLTLCMTFATFSYYLLS